MQTCVIGLGNIGSQLLKDLIRNNINSVGVDINPQLVASLQAEGYTVSTKVDDFKSSDVWLISISTGPNMEQLFQLIKELQPKQGSLISIESTVIPGTMNTLANWFQSLHYTIGQDLFLIHVPHRINFGIDQSVFDSARVIAGLTNPCLQTGLAFYKTLVPYLVPVSDIRLAELSKIVENSIRHLNIALAEILSQYCLEEGLDFNELRSAVNSKGNVSLLDIDYGIGGECLNKDMQFLTAITNAPLLESALETDAVYRDQLYNLLKAESGVLIKGVTYKPDLKNLNFSCGIELYQKLNAYGTPVYVTDPMYTAEELADLGLRPWKDEEISKVIYRGKISELTKALKN